MKVQGSKPAGEVEQYRARNNPLTTRTYAEIDAHIDGLTDLDDVKQVLKLLAKATKYAIRPQDVDRP